jgi:hypothetical protein
VVEARVVVEGIFHAPKYLASFLIDAVDQAGVYTWPSSCFLS